MIELIILGLIIFFIGIATDWAFITLGGGILFFYGVYVSVQNYRAKNML